MFRRTVTTAVSLRPFQVIAEKDATAYFCHRSGVAWTVALLCIAIPFSFFVCLNVLSVSQYVNCPVRWQKQTLSLS